MKKWFSISVILFLLIILANWTFREYSQPKTELDRLNEVVFGMVEKHNLSSTHTDLQNKLIYIEVSDKTNINKFKKDIQGKLDQNNLQHYSLKIEEKD